MAVSHKVRCRPANYCRFDDWDGILLHKAVFYRLGIVDLQALAPSS